MLTFLSNRSGLVVRVMEATGVVAMIISFRVIFGKNSTNLIKIFFLITITEYAFIRFCATKRWYKNAPRYSGIELHFSKIIVFASYVMAITGMWFLMGDTLIPFIISSILLLIVAHINVILLYFHFRDHQDLPVNYYTSRAFLTKKDDANHPAL